MLSSIFLHSLREPFLDPCKELFTEPFKVKEAPKQYRQLFKPLQYCCPLPPMQLAHRGPAGSHHTEACADNWVLVTGFNLSYDNKETLLFTVDPYYSN